MLFEQYIKEYPGSSYSYASFCRHYAQRKIENGIRQIGGNVERIPGERMEVDFAGDKIEWVDRDGVSGSQSYLSLHYRTAACFLRKLLKMKAKTAG